MDKRLVMKETGGAGMCEFCGGSVTLKEWFIKDEQSGIDETHSGFLYVCEGCGHGAEHEAEIVRMVQAVAKGEIVFDEDDEDFET